MIHHDRSYLDLPLVDTDIVINIEEHNVDRLLEEMREEFQQLQNYRTEYNLLNDFPRKENSIGELNHESFLMEMGYNTSVYPSKRHEILGKAIQRFGKRRVVDLLQFHINLRKGNGNRYSRAIRIWREDIDFVIDYNE